MISHVLQESTAPIIEKNRGIIAQYCADIDKMNDLVDGVLLENDRCLIPIYREELEPLGLNDLANKINGSRFCRCFWDRVKKNEFGEGKLELNRNFWNFEGFNNKQLCLDFRFATYDNDKPYYLLGIQIQGNQYRRCAQIGKTKTPFSAEDVFNEFKDGWFDPDYKGGKKEKKIIMMPGLEQRSFDKSHSSLRPI